MTNTFKPGDVVTYRCPTSAYIVVIHAGNDVAGYVVFSDLWELSGALVTIGRIERVYD